MRINFSILDKIDETSPVTITRTEYNEYQSMKTTRDRETARIREYFRIKSVCSSCGIQSMDIQPDLGNMCSGTWCEGSMISLKN